MRIFKRMSLEEKMQSYEARLNRIRRARRQHISIWEDRQFEQLEKDIVHAVNRLRMKLDGQ